MEEKNINSSIEFIGSIENNLPFVLKGSHTPYHLFLGNIYKEDSCHYNVKMQTTFREYIEMRDIPNVILETPKGEIIVNKILINSIDGTNVSGEVNDFSLNTINKQEKKYFRLVIKRKDKEKLNLRFFFDYIYPFKMGDYKSVSQLKVKIGTNDFDFYFYLFQDTQYIFIDSKQELTYKDFYRSIYSILLSFGFITGRLPMDEGYFFAYQDKDLNNNVFIKYTSLVGSLTNIYNPIYTNAFGYIFNDKERAQKLNEQLKGITEKNFSNLCSKAFDSPEFSSAMYLLMEGSKGSLQMTAGNNAICLETLTNIIADENEEKLNPIKSKTIAQEIRGELLKVVEKYKDEINEGYQILKNKITNINQATNKDKLIKPFEILGIRLTDDDKECIDKRNDFLHGRMPDIEMGKILDENEFGKIFHITLKLNVLINALILKTIGFSGKILNHTQIHTSITKIDLHEEIYRAI